MPTLKSIYIVGAPCTGKTTLLKALQERYAQAQALPDGIPQPAIITEVARTVLLQLEINRNDIANSPEKCLQLQRAILDAQYAAEVELSKAEQWYISDRSGMDPIVFTQLYVDQDATTELLASPAWKGLEEKMREGLVVLCESGCSWLVDDGTRLMPRDADEWCRFDQAFVELLSQRQIEPVLLSKDMASIEERVRLVVRAHGRQQLRDCGQRLEGQSNGSL